MAVILGSARSDERGKATGGQAGDQTGRESMHSELVRLRDTFIDIPFFA